MRRFALWPLILAASCAVLRAEMATRRQGAPAITPCEGGVGVARFDLSPLPKNARIYRADLRISMTAEITGRDAEALVNIEILPLFSQSKPDSQAKPLALRGPWFDCFDATEAVQAWKATTFTSSRFAHRWMSPALNRKPILATGLLRSAWGFLISGSGPSVRR